MLVGAKEVREKYGLEPHQMVDYKSLVGDVSDNVPGVTGIGPKTAASLLQKYHTLENLFKHMDEQPESVRSKLKDGKETALAAKKLVELDRRVGIEFELGKLEFKPDWEKVRREYEELGFKSIVAKLPRGREEVPQVPNVPKVPKVSKGGTIRSQKQLELIK